jgi:transposase
MEVLGVLQTIKVYKEAIEAYEEALRLSLEWVAEEATLSFHQGWDAGCDHAWQVAGKHGSFPWNDKANLNERAKEMAKRIKAESHSEASDGSREDTLEKVGEALKVRALTIWEAFSRFCREQTGLEPETVLQAWFPPALRLPEELGEAVESARVNPTLLEDYEAMLVRTWRELVGP